MKNTLSLKKHLLCDLLVHIMRELLKFVNCNLGTQPENELWFFFKVQQELMSSREFPQTKSESLEISVNRTNYKNTQRERTTQQGPNELKTQWRKERTYFSHWLGWFILGLAGLLKSTTHSSIPFIYCVVKKVTVRCLPSESPFSCV